MNRIFKAGLVVATMAFACNENTEASSQEIITKDSATTTKTTAAAPSPIDTSLSGCYSMTVNKDTAALQLQRKGNIITGSLSYHNYQKDRNVGSFQGEVVNNLLTGWYLFRSEGVISVRQVAWKIAAGSLWPGFGETGMRNDTSYFVDPSRLQFDSTRALKKVNCVI